MATKELESPKTLTKTKVVLVTPEMAENWLLKNVSNRKLKPHRIAEIMQWIRKGQWETTTDAIGFSTNDELINGQHRLWAIVKTKTPCELLVATGLSPEAFNVIDTVKVRSATDVLGVNGFGSAGVKSGIVRFVMTFRKNKFGAIEKMGFKINNQEVLDFAISHRDQLDEAGSVAQKTISKFRGIESRYIGGLYWIFAEKDKIQAELFFKYYEDGAGLPANNPIMILRMKLIQNMGSNKKVSATTKLAWCIMAWNFIRSGKPIKQIRWSDGDEFPKPI